MVSGGLELWDFLDEVGVWSLALEDWVSVKKLKVTTKYMNIEHYVVGNLRTPRCDSIY